MAFTFFFRDFDCLELAVKHLIAGCLGRSRVRVWDAGCAMGQEPYTLAILLAEKVGTFAFRNLEIFATDYDRPLLDIVSAGIYQPEEVQRIPPVLFNKYFEPIEGSRQYRVTEMLRNCVKPRYHDLKSFVPIRDGFSLIVCKNVLLHFQQDERAEVIRMFYKALEPGGLFVTEHTQKMPKEVTSFFQQIALDGQLFRKVEICS